VNFARPPSHTPRPITTQLQHRENATVLRIRPAFRRGGNLLLDLPIAGRLTLGFLTAAIIAALVAGTIGLQRTQSLNRQSDFYQNLLQTNTALTTGASFLQLMNTETHVTINDAAVAQPSQETLTTDKNAVQGLVARYDNILTTYISQHMLNKHPDQIALLAEANHEGQADQQVTLVGSVLRTWQVYRAAQDQVLQDITAGKVLEAQHFEQVQGEPTQADATSALRSLVQFDSRLATSVHDAADVETQSQLIATIIGSILAFIAIALVGWFISGTLVRRLKDLRRVTQAVEHGQLDARVTVIGRDEIADVSASVNAMLTAIVGLLEETRRQRDALTNAAEHLFSNMRVVSSGDLRINTPVSNDPIGMLANAFNFTVSRFRRFVLRTQTTAEQLDVIARQELERTEAFWQALNSQSSHSSGNTPTTSSPAITSPLKNSPEAQEADIIRLGSGFAGDMVAMGRHLAALAHEMRTAAVSFQLDTAEVGKGNVPVMSPAPQYISPPRNKSASRSGNLDPNTGPQHPPYSSLQFPPQQENTWMNTDNQNRW